MLKIMTNPITVLGAGSWGTALAIHLAQSGSGVRLWDFDSTQIALLKQHHCNQKYLPDISLPKNISYFDSLKTALNGVKDVLVVVPSFAFADTLKNIKPFLSKTTRIMWATKGVDPTSHVLLDRKSVV